MYPDSLSWVLSDGVNSMIKFWTEFWISGKTLIFVSWGQSEPEETPVVQLMQVEVFRKYPGSEHD